MAELDGPTQAKVRFSISSALFPILISILALSVAVRQSLITGEGTSANVYGGSVSVVLEVDKAHLSNPDLRPYFYGRRQLDKGDPLTNRVEALAEFILDCFQLILTGIKTHPAYYQDPEGDREWITDSFRHSIVLSNYLDSHKRWYAGEIFKLRDKATVGRN